MNYTVDEIIRYCSVRILSGIHHNQVIGSGVLLRHEELDDKMYLLTAVHCVEPEHGEFLDSIEIDIYNPSSNAYSRLRIDNLRNKTIYLKHKNQEVAIIVLKASNVLQISPNLPSLAIVPDSALGKHYICAGFPNASCNAYEQTNASWIYQNSALHTMSLRLENDYISGYVEGFSGGGIFCVTHNEALLVGIISEFRIEERGRYINGSDFFKINEILYDAHFPLLNLSYLIADGLTEQAMEEALHVAYCNLGKRYMPTFNVRTEIQKKLDAVCRTSKYKEGLFEAINGWLNSNNFLYRQDGEIYDKVAMLREQIIQYIKGIEHSPVAQIDLSGYMKIADEIISALNEEEEKLEKNRVSKEGEARSGWSKQEDNIIRMRQYCYELLSLEQTLDITVANSNFLIIHGEAGCGKSHLLGYFSQITQNEHCPVLLLLGGNFSASSSIEENIVKQLKSSCSFEDILSGLNRVGMRLGRRVPILIDALNETQGMNYWRDRLPGFLECVTKYPHIALVVSIRDTYLNRVLSEYSRHQWAKIMCKHEGFKDDEYAAIQRFCEYYGLTVLNMPVLNPEFANPLYLHMACSIAKSSGKERLPMGWDMYDLFEKYAKKLDNDFDNLRDGLYTNRHIVTKATTLLADKMFAAKREWLPLSECDELIQNEIRNSSYLLTDLLESSLLALDCDYEGREYIRFTYQRIGDYYMAKMLLDKCKTKEDVSKRLCDYADVLTKYGRLDGVLEQLFIMIPERFDVELWEVMDEKKVAEWMRMLLYSFHWRSAKHIHTEEIIRFVSEHRLSRESWWNTLLFLAPIPHHPFNGDRWHAIMKRQGSMADRDGVLQHFILETVKWDSNNHINRMITWAWTPEVSKLATDEVAWQVAVTLTWILSSTIHQLRDQVTKALVNLLQHKPKVLLKLLHEFQDVDDTYIKERLLAIAYGCVLRCEQKEDIVAIGRYVYESVFSNGNPPRHLLLRDYACNIVDYAYKMYGLDEIDMQLVLPPYNAKMPSLPTREDVERFRIDYNDKSEKYAWSQNAILNSLYDSISDFGTKILSPNIDYFVSDSFKIENDLQNFIKQCRGKKKDWVKAYVEARTMQINIERQKEMPYTRIDETYARLVEDFVRVSNQGLQKFLSKDEWDLLNNLYIPNHANKGCSRFDRYRDKSPYRYWVVQRVFELGYDRNKHGSYDEEIQRIDNSYSYRKIEGRKERIGKKYEWIAYWELMGCFADNYHIESPWDNSKKILYDGAWQNYWRDCDPACITRRNEDDTVDTWKDYFLRRDWNIPLKQWLTEPWTLDEVRQMILRKDPSGENWFTMYDFQYIHPPQELGEDRYRSKRFLNYGIRAYLIRKSKKKEIIDLAQKVNFDDYELKSSVDSSAYYVTREKYWSRACKIDKPYTARKWEPLFEGCKVNVMVPYVAMNGNIEGDDSGTRASYNMPIQTIFEDMNMRYADVDGDFIQDGKLCATCNPNRTNHFLMHCDRLVHYLKSKNLDIVWIVDSERFFNPDSYVSVPAGIWQHSGLFYLDEKGELQGTFKVKIRK